MEAVLSLYEQPAQAGGVRLCFDERPCQLLDEMVTPLPLKADQPARIDNEYVRKGTAVVLLAYDMDKGLRYCQVRQQRTKADYAQFMHWLVSTYSATAEAVDLVQDNLNTHTYGAFYEHLPLAQARALQQKVRFHFTPKHGSWLNMAEIEFSVLARPCLNRRIGSLEELERQVLLWPVERNRTASKIHWSFTVTKAETKLTGWYEQVNPVNKPKQSKI